MKIHLNKWQNDRHSCWMIPHWVSHYSHFIWRRDIKEKKNLMHAFLYLTTDWPKKKIPRKVHALGVLKTVLRIQLNQLQTGEPDEVWWTCEKGILAIILTWTRTCFGCLETLQWRDYQRRLERVGRGSGRIRGCRRLRVLQQLLI